MKKAERIYRATRYECKQLYKHYGKQINPNGKPVSISSLCIDDNESVCTRTCNAIQRILNSEKRNAQFDLKLGIFDSKRYEDEMYLLEMIQVALDATKRDIA